MKSLTAADLFKDNDMQGLFSLLEKELLAFGGVEESVTATQVAFKCKRQFAWLWSPPSVNRKLMLTLDMLHEVKHPLFVSVDHPRHDKWTYQIHISDSSTAQLVVTQGWLHDAYLFGRQ